MAIPFYAKSEDNQGYIKNMEVIAYDDLDGGSIFQPQLWRTEEGKYYLYGTMGNAIGILDVTDAAHPVTVSTSVWESMPNFPSFVAKSM